MSLSLSQTIAADPDRVQTPHKTKKRKHVAEAGSQSPTKKHKKSKSEDTIAPQSQTDLLAKRGKSKSNPKPKGQNRPSTPQDTPSPSDVELPEAPSSPIQPLPNGALHDQFSPQNSFQDEITISIDKSSPSAFASVRLSLYLPLPAISISAESGLSSLLAIHLSPLLLTYYAPAKGVVLAFSDPSLSASRPTTIISDASHEEQQQQQRQTFALAECADHYGVSYIWLTVTFLVFRPTKHQELDGYINICSEGFMGLVSYNYFQTGIARNRIPKSWMWNAALGEDAGADTKKKKTSKAKIKPSNAIDEEDIDMENSHLDPIEAELNTQLSSGQVSKEDVVEAEEASSNQTGFFLDSNGVRVQGRVRFRAVDVDVVPGTDSDKWSLEIEGTLLNAEDETVILAEEKLKADRLKQKLHKIPSAEKSGGILRR